MMDERQAIENNYPEAITVPDLIKKINEIIREQGVDRDNVKPGKAHCRDDSVQELTEELIKNGYGTQFSFQSLTGLPVYGKTPFTAWYHHIPDEGMGLIIYAPHSGFDDNGKIGYLKRPGIKKTAITCGANHGLLALWNEHNFGPYDDDSELSEVSRMLYDKRSQILDNSSPLKELVEVEYDIGFSIISDRITYLLDKENHKFLVLLIGGVHIDTSPGLNNMFQVRDIILYKHDTGPVNILK